MKVVSLFSLHQFNKVNLMTKFDKLGPYDIQRCDRCGLQGKRYGLDDNILVLDEYSESQIRGCKNVEDTFVGRDVVVVRCDAMGAQFANLAVGSRHEVVSPPDNQINGDRGIWVMGVGEPVKLLFGEFDFAKEPVPVEESYEGWEKEWF